MGSREINTYNIYTSQLAEKIPGSVWFNTFEEVAQYAVEKAEAGDLIITLGCGDIYKAAKIMIKIEATQQRSAKKFSVLELSSQADFLFFATKRSLRIGINVTERAPDVITKYKKSGTVKAAV
jgi:hypothetical protein